MKILLGNNTFSLLAGSERHVQTLAGQLKKIGHDVWGFSPELGYIANEMKKEGIPCFDNISTSGVKPFSIVLEEKFDFDCDVIIANHWHIVEFLRSQYPTKPIISTIHGIIHKDENGNDAPEHPSLKGGVNQFVAVSEEVQDLLKKEYNIDSIIIRNFFDLRKFKCDKKLSTKPKQIFFNSNYALPTDSDILILKEVAKHYGAKLAAIGQNFGHNTDPIVAIKNSDIVIGMGRSVLEGVAAGKIGIVHGRWGTGGVINEENIAFLREYNFSGRNSHGVVWTKEKFIEEIDKNYNQKTADWGKDYIAKEHNVVFAADMYLQIARDLLGQNIKKAEEIPLKPYRKQKDVKLTDN